MQNNNQNNKLTNTSSVPCPSICNYTTNVNYQSNLNRINNVDINCVNELSCKLESNIINLNVNNIVHTINLDAANTNNEAASVHLHIDQWLSTISQMRLSLSSTSLSVSELDELEHHIRFGISLPLIEQPSSIHYSNTTTVLEHQQLVADRISEYISIGAIQVVPLGFQ